MNTTQAKDSAGTATALADWLLTRAMSEGGAYIAEAKIAAEMAMTALGGSASESELTQRMYNILGDTEARVAAAILGSRIWGPGLEMSDLANNPGLLADRARVALAAIENPWMALKFGNSSYGGDFTASGTWSLFGSAPYGTMGLFNSQLLEKAGYGSNLLQRAALAGSELYYGSNASSLVNGLFDFATGFGSLATFDFSQAGVCSGKVRRNLQLLSMMGRCTRRSQDFYYGYLTQS